MITDFLGIIPARYTSTRFPGKPLAMLGSKPMIQWVCEGAEQLFRQVVVATDDDRILQAVESFGGKVVMTSPDHTTGTERCAEAYRIFREVEGRKFSHVVNIQGDEPLLKAEQLEQLVDCAREEGVQIATLVRPIREKEETGNPNVVKVVVDRSFNALYFSRSVIPHIRDALLNDDDHNIPYYAHIGLYAFRSEVLEKVVTLSPTSLEKAESLEQLRWMEHGIPIRTRITMHRSLGVDTPEDLERIRAMI
jgi:3-deoxy-manno-octulosonate cytidylyltransferase (CMP-KDO synthetase)